MAQLILASQSPRRRKLIELLGRPVHVVPAGVDEETIDDPDPRTNVLRTADLKANAVAARFPEDVVIAADTTVAVDGHMLGKPAGTSEAVAMLRRLRGRAHQVHTGLVLLQASSSRRVASVSSTDVVMRPYTNEEINRYIASGDPMDKAGAYAIQHPDFAPVAQVHGCYSGVVGLSLCQLCVALRRLGIDTDLDVAEQTQDYRDCPVCQTLIPGPSSAL